MGIVFFKKKDINFGDQFVTELTVLEWKRLFSIKLFKFHKTDGCQDRFHTHSFNSVSFLIKGNYVEEILCDSKIVQLNRNRSRFIYIPSNEYHRITRSDGCITCLITGPWAPVWSELRDLGDGRYQEVTCGEHRVDVKFGEVVSIQQ